MPRWLGALVVVVISALPGPSPAGAPPGKVPTIGFLCARPGPSSHTEMFEIGMRELGYAVGTDVRIEYRFARDVGVDPFPDFVADLVRRKVDVIVVGSPLALLPAQKGTRTVPLIMAQSDDPVAQGLVASLARPGGNVTGLSSMAPELSVKQLELLKALRPELSRVGVLSNAASALTRPLRERLERRAREAGVQVLSLSVRSDPKEFERAFAAMSRAGAEALIVLPDMMFFDHPERLVGLAAKQRLPTIYGDREFVDTGGLLSYGTNYDELFRRAAYYVDKVLKGAKPADLPVEQPSKFELVINLKTAKALGLPVPPALLLRADHVIE